MKILKTNSMKKEFNNDKENPLEMKLINKMKKILIIINNVFKSKNDLKEIETIY